MDQEHRTEDTKKVSETPIPHSGDPSLPADMQDQPVNKFENTPLIAADAMLSENIPQDPSTMIENMPPLTTITDPEHVPKKRKGLVIGISVGLAGAAIAAGTIIGINANHSDDTKKNEPPKADPKATSATTPSAAPTAEKSPSATETEATKAELARLDTEAKTNPEAFLQEPLSKQLMWRDQYTEQVVKQVNGYAINPQHYVVDANPSVNDDGQTIMNDTLVGVLGLGRGFLTSPSDANGNKWTEDYNMGKSYFASQWVTETANPNAANNISRINNMVATMQSFPDSESINADYTAQKTSDGQPVQIEGQDYPTKTIDVISEDGHSITITVALFKYKDASGKEKSQWVQYKAANNN